MSLDGFHMEPYGLRMDETTSEQSRHVGEQVEARIKANNLTLDDIVAATGIPKTTLWRNLKQGDFKLIHLSLIAEALGTTAGAIVTEFEAAS